MRSSPGFRPSLVDILVAGAPAALLALLALLPFANKAFTIDDMTFMVMARHALTDFWHPSAIELVFEGVRERVSTGMVSGPIMPWLLLPSAARGGVEWIAHAPVFALDALGAFATAAIALRLGLARRAAMIAALVVAVAPSVLVMASTDMPDVPAMTLGALAIERAIAWRSERRLHQALATSLLLALAGLARPHVTLLGVPIAILLLFDGERGPWSRAWWRSAPRQLANLGVLALAGVLFFAVVWLTRDPEGHNVASISLARFGNGNNLVNLLGFQVHWCIVMPFALPWAALHLARLVRDRLGWLTLIAGALLPMAYGAWSRLWWLLPLSALSVWSICDVLIDGWRRRDEAQLALGVTLLIALPAAFYVHLPSKYLVPSMPAAAILLVRAAATRGRFGRTIVGLTLLYGLSLSLLMLHADDEHSEIGRHGGEIVQRYVDRGTRVWSDGGWGFEWYALRAGATPLTNFPPWARAGDVIVSTYTGLIADRYINKTLIEHWVDETPGGRIQNPESGACFYSDICGFLPWSWSRIEVGHINVWQITDNADAD